MGRYFFKQCITLFLYNKTTEEYEKLYVKGVYFRYDDLTQQIAKGIQGNASGTITIPLDYATIDGVNACKSYKADTNAKDFVLNGIFIEHTWDLENQSYVVEGIIDTDVTIRELISNYKPFRITNVRDCRKGTLQHLKLEVRE